MQAHNLVARPCWVCSGMLGDALTLYYAYSGDASALALFPPMVEYVLANGTTPTLPRWAYPGVPYASSTGGDLYFSGAADEDVYGCYGCGDGYGIIEPDKLGELGLQVCLCVCAFVRACVRVCM